MSLLDHNQIRDAPVPIYMGELPTDYRHVPAPVVVNLCGVFPPALPPVEVVFSLPLRDSLHTELFPTRERLERFLDAVHLHSEHQASYWHCHAGINRAGLALATYLHRFYDLRISEAIDTLRAKRSPMVLCNHLFERRLREWYGDADEQDFATFSMEDYMAEMRRHAALKEAKEAALQQEEE